MHNPQRGDVWVADLDPTRGHEQFGKRPVLIVSADRFNFSGAGLVLAVPLTTKRKGVPYHVPIDSPDGGTKRPGFIKCEDIRSIDKDRLSSHMGTVSDATMEEVEDRLKRILMLD